MIKKIKFKNWHILAQDELSLEGEITFKNNKAIIIGDNGLGKTSFMNTIFGILTRNQRLYDYVRFDSFSIEFLNGDLVKLTNNSAIKSFQQIVEFTDLPYQRNIQILINEFQALKVKYSVIFEKLNLNFKEGDTQFAKEMQQALNNIDTNEIWINNNHIVIHQNQPQGLKSVLSSIIGSILGYLNSANAKFNNKNSEKNNKALLNWTVDKDFSYVSIFRNASDYFSEHSSNINAHNVNLINYELQKPKISTVISDMTINLKNTVTQMKTSFFDNIVDSFDDDGDLSEVEIQEIEVIGELIHDEKFQAAAEKLKLDTNFKKLCANNFKHTLSKFTPKIKGELENVNEWINISNQFLNSKTLSWESGEFWVNASNDKKIFNESLFSAGEKNLLILLRNIIILKPKLLIIDEPELSLSIKWQSLLSNVINEAKDTLFIITTHSPYMISDSDAEHLQGIESWKK